MTTKQKKNYKHVGPNVWATTRALEIVKDWDFNWLEETEFYAEFPHDGTFYSVTLNTEPSLAMVFRDGVAVRCSVRQRNNFRRGI